MALLQIYSLDDENENTIISTLSEGEHPIGRDKLNCRDKRVSRNHAIIKVTKDKVTLKSTHVNPSFYKPCGGNSIRLITTDEVVVINDGDQFGLLADAFWFKTRVIESNNSIKRPYNEIEVEAENKRVKVSEDEETSNCNIGEEKAHKEQIESDSNEAGSDESLDFADILNKNNGENEILEPDKTSEQQNEILERNKSIIENKENQPEDNEQQNDILETNKPIVDNKDNQPEENEQPIKILEINKPLVDYKDSQLEENAEVKANVNMCEHTSEESDKNQSDKELNQPNNHTLNKNDSPIKKSKQKCWYGAKCYRKNIDHKQEYSHPGDPDYDENYIPDCPFGSACYRKNMLHRQQYKHTNPPAPKPAANPNAGGTSHQINSDDDDDSADDNTTGRKKRRAATKVKKYAETPEDDYDLEDPFINDGSSDDFELTDDDESDSDSQDSQEADEESQERKRLLKEAKKFIKKKK